MKEYVWWGGAVVVWFVTEHLIYSIEMMETAC